MTDKSALGGEFFVAMLLDGRYSIGSLEVGITTTCDDGTCQVGEPVIEGVPDTPGVTCPEDCPVVLGTCPGPGSTGVGDPAAQCGGHGWCNLATLTCVCAESYAGDACDFCAPGYVRRGGGGGDSGEASWCEVNTSALRQRGGTDTGSDTGGQPGGQPVSPSPVRVPPLADTSVQCNPELASSAIVACIRSRAHAIPLSAHGVHTCVRCAARMLLS